MGEAKKCKNCQLEIDARVKKCPQCQADLKNWFVRKQILSGIGILVLLVIIFSAACQSDNKSESAPTSASANATPVTTTTAPELTVVDLTAFIEEFDASETAALYKYKDKYVQLSGYVNTFRAASAAGTFAVIVPNQSQDAGYDETVTYAGTAIECLFNKADIPTLTNGEKVTVKGQVSDMAMRRIQLKNCSVMK